MVLTNAVSRRARISTDFAFLYKNSNAKLFPYSGAGLSRPYRRQNRQKGERAAADLLFRRMVAISELRQNHANMFEKNNG